MTLRVYVIGASAEIERVEGVIAKLRAAGGIDITHDWTADVRAARAAGYASDAALTDEAARAAALADLDAVRAARVVLLLAPSSPSFGAGVEFGTAIERVRAAFLERKIVIAGPHARVSIFTRVTGRIVDTDEDGIAEVLWLRDRVAL